MKKWIFPVLTAMAAALLSLINFEDLPVRMAMHFSISETPDNYMNKPLAAFFIPAVILLVTVIKFISIKFEKDENKRRRMDATIGSVVAIISVTFFLYFSLA